MAVVVVVLSMGSLAAGCSKGGKGSKSGDWDGPVAYDEDGNEKPCPEPESQCEERKEPSLAFKDACSVGGYRMQLCGCEELCSSKLKEAIPDAPPPEEEKKEGEGESKDGDKKDGDKKDGDKKDEKKSDKKKKSE
jgi:hypothetical protein